MSQPILLKNAIPDVDRRRLGISYSGGGALVVIELGIALAFVQEGIIPDVITGASAGALAGTAHALDVRGGKGIDMAADILSGVSDSTVGLDPLDVGRKLIAQRTHLAGMGDNAPIGNLVRDGVARYFGLHDVTVGTFVPPRYPRLLVVATDVVAGESVWFPDDTPIEEALIASSAVPGLFPGRVMTLGGQERYLVDGAVVSNQPLSNLAVAGCGTIYSCAVGPTFSARPANALENAMRAVYQTIHQCTKLEEEFVRLRLGDKVVVHHIHPKISYPMRDFNFTPEFVRAVIQEACAKTRAWLREGHPD